MTPDEELKKLQADSTFSGGTTYGRTPGGIVNLGTGAITSQSLAPTTQIPFNTPSPTVTPSVAGLDTTTNQQTALPEEQKQSETIKRTQELFKSLTGEASFQAEQETAAGLTPELLRTQTDLSNRLKAVQTEALQIPLQLQQEATGRGITAGGLQPIQTAALRNNAIQALGISSLLEASKNNIATAQSLADRAVKAKFDPIKAEIDANLRNLDLMSKDPTLTLAQQNRLIAQQEIQKSREAKVKKQEADNSTVLGMAASAVLNNPGNQAALMAAEKARQLDPTSPNYLNDAYALVGQYQKDPVATERAIKENQLLDAQIEVQKANAAKIKADNPDIPTIKNINGVDMQWNPKTEKWETIGAGPSATVSKSADQITFLKDTAKTALELAGAAGRSGARRTAEAWFVGSTNYTKLESVTNTLKVNVLSLMTDPNIKKFFGPQMSNADVLLMTSAGTTLNPETNSPDQMKGEIKRLQSLFDRMQASLNVGSLSGDTLDSQVAERGYNYAQMKADGLSDDEIKSLLGI